LNRPALAVLAAWKMEQSSELSRCGIEHPEFIFTGNNGKVMNPENITKYFASFAKKYNLPGFHAHALRHTMASLSIANGADVLSVSKKLGHSKPDITLSVYSHATDEAQRRANEILAAALYEKKA
jgi:integrase